MILDFTKKTLQPGMVALVIQGSMHTGPDCMRLTKAVEAMIAENERRIIFDLGALTHADSAAIGAIVRCLASIKKVGGMLRIVTAQPMIVHSLQLTKVDKLIPIFATVEAAAADFSLPGAGAAKSG